MLRFILEPGKYKIKTMSGSWHDFSMVLFIVFFGAWLLMMGYGVLSKYLSWPTIGYIDILAMWGTVFFIQLCIRTKATDQEITVTKLE